MPREQEDLRPNKGTSSTKRESLTGAYLASQVGMIEKCANQLLQTEGIEELLHMESTAEHEENRARAAYLMEFLAIHRKYKRNTEEIARKKKEKQLKKSESEKKKNFEMLQGAGPKQHQVQGASGVGAVATFSSQKDVRKEGSELKGGVTSGGEK